jgi:tRNA dimethylallyltransferase
MFPQALQEPLRFLIGPTAVGKSAAALELAREHGLELLSLDSMQVYRGMDIGTAKPTPEERALVPHHMLDRVGPKERYDVSRYLGDLAAVEAELGARSVRAVHIGGTGFYLKARLAGLFEGPAVDLALRAELEARHAEEGAAALHAELARVDPLSAARLHANDRKRVVRALEVYQQTGRPLSAWQEQWSRAPLSARIVGLRMPGEQLDVRILARVRQMLAQGWVEEVRRLDTEGWLGPTASQALGYATVRSLARGERTLEDCTLAIALATRQFARRQQTWWRKFEIAWIDAQAPSLTRAIARAWEL